ncbi:MAG TPA: ROK family protein [Methylophilaceae bacterium]|jgi:glucokinase
MVKHIGVDIGGTNLRFGIVEGLRVIDETRVSADFANICRTHAPAQAWQTIINIIAEHIQQCILNHPEIASVGIGFPGFIDAATGRLAQSPNLPGLMDVDLAKDLSQALNMPVIVENDALAAAYGEYQLLIFPVPSLIYIGLGTGVGGGLIYNGQVFPGQHGMAMEVGHIIVEPDGRLCGCGNYGCLEQYASASGVSKSYQLATQQIIAAHEIASLATRGEQAAIDAYETAGDAIAQVVAHIAKVLDVGTVVIGGGMSQAWPLMLPAFSQRLAKDLIPVLRDKVNVYASKSGDQAGMIGAALLSASKH